MILKIFGVLCTHCSLTPDVNNTGFDLSRQECDQREWVRDIWNGWFDQVFPPTPSESEDEEPEDPQDEQVSPTREEKEKEKKR